MRTYLRMFIAAGLVALTGCGATESIGTRIESRSEELYASSDWWRSRDASEARRSRPPINADATLDDYVRIGLLRNAGLRASFDRWRSAMRRVPQAEALPDPLVSFTYFVEEIQTRTGPQRLQGRLMQKFPWFGKRRLRGDVAREQAEIFWWKVQTKRLAVVREIKRAYYEYAYLVRAIRITEDSLELLKQLEPAIQRNVEAGGDQGALLRLQVEIGRLDNDLRSLRQFRPAVSSRLSAAINRSSTTPLPWPALDAMDVTAVNREALIKRLAEKNPALEAARQDIRKERTRIQLARRNRYPDVTVGVGYFETGGAIAPVAPTDSGNDPVSVTVGLSIPLWRGKYRAAIEEAEAAQDAAQTELIEQRNVLTAELEHRLFKLDDAARQISLFRDTLIPRSRQAMQVTRTSYLAGKAMMLDLIDSERTLLSFEKAYWRANADYAQSLADIEALVGGEIE